MEGINSNLGITRLALSAELGAPRFGGLIREAMAGM